MAVAKMYEGLETVGDVFFIDGNMYINVKLKTGKIKSVKWYNDSEYRKLYPDVKKPNHSADRFYKSQKEVLGFSNGYITIFKGNTDLEKEWFKAANATYTRFWGWSIASTRELPQPLPRGIEPVKLSWDLVGNDDDRLKPDHLVKEAVESLFYEDSDSEFVGSIGERLELYVTIEKVIPIEGKYGRSQMYIMFDDCGNIFTWTTAAKTWAAGTEHHIRGTVKEHSKYKNECRTVLTRCMEVK